MNKVFRLCLFCCNSEDKNKEGDQTNAKAKPEITFEKLKKNLEQIPELPKIKQNNDESLKIRDSSESFSISSGG